MKSIGCRLALMKVNKGILRFQCDSCQSLYVFVNKRNVFYSRFFNIVFSVGAIDGWWAADDSRKEAFFGAVEESHSGIVSFETDALLCPNCESPVPPENYGGIAGSAFIYHAIFDNEVASEGWGIVMPPNYQWPDGLFKETSGISARICPRWWER